MDNPNARFFYLEFRNRIPDHANRDLPMAKEKQSEQISIKEISGKVYLMDRGPIYGRQVKYILEPGKRDCEMDQDDTHLVITEGIQS